MLLKDRLARLDNLHVSFSEGPRVIRCDSSVGNVHNRYPPFSTCIIVVLLESKGRKLFF